MNYGEKYGKKTLDGGHIWDVKGLTTHKQPLLSQLLYSYQVSNCKACFMCIIKFFW